MPPSAVAQRGASTSSAAVASRRIVYVALVLALVGLARTVACPVEPPKAAAPAPAPAPLLSRAGDGVVPFAGLASPIDAGSIPKWPVELMPLRARLACLLGCSQWQQLDLALSRAAQWMAGFQQDALRFDAAMILAMTRESVDSAALRVAFERARTVADRDDDNPQRRFWNPDVSAPVEHTSRWPVPTEAGTRVNTNRVVAEALFCKEYGWRPETMRYTCGPMRDDGGYQSTHALWALFIAHRNGCIAEAVYEPCVRDIQGELADKQPSAFEPQATLDIDLYAERLQTLLLTGSPHPAINDWAETLLRLQGPDGSWGVSKDGENPYYRFHATAVTTWALAEWYRRLVAHPEMRPK